MTVNSTDGNNKVIQIGYTPKSTENPPTQPSSVYSEALKKKDPCKFYYLEAKRAELELNYTKAYELYLQGFQEAQTQKLSCAVHLKWNSMRCVEFAKIYSELMREWETNKKRARKVGNQLIMHWHDESECIPKGILEPAKKQIPIGFSYNIVIWNTITNTVRFINSKGYYSESDPKLDAEWAVYASGNPMYINHFSDPEILFDKWMYGETVNTFDRRVAIRRSIRTRYLEIPTPLRIRMHKANIWNKYVVPAIGNRSLGKLYEEFLKNGEL